MSSNEEDKPEGIGSATMMTDGTLVLTLRAEGPGGVVGHGQFVYAPDHPEYETVKNHIGQIDVDQTRPVPPWDDQ
jgi:hypothetical protein